MSTLFDAMQGKTYARTANGAITLPDSGNALVDLFAAIGSSRGKDISSVFLKAFRASDVEAILATRMLLWARDIRGGSGERKTFRDLLVVLEREDGNLCRCVVNKIPVVGRWDDIFALRTTAMRDYAFEMVEQALVDGNGLCAKWMPRKGPEAIELRNFLGMSPKRYRKTLVELTNVVETDMCAKNWKEINYNHVPSVAANRYTKAFLRNDETRYRNYLGAIEKGTAKINASAIFPYDVIKGLRSNEQMANAQWNALPDYIDGNTENFLCVVDVSGSMDQGLNGEYYSKPTCMDVAISLGLYMAERSKGIFKDEFITFDTRPQLVKLQGTLAQRHRKMENAAWGGSTNFQATFDLILNAAQKNHIPESEMPTKILVFSDMEFNSAGGSKTNFQAIERKFAAAGYKRPDIVFWNLNARQGNSPVRFDQNGTALVSGYSPSLMKSILSGKTITPFMMMMDTIMNERYDMQFK